MRLPAHWPTAAVGLALLIYGGASLTGAWLGEPTWWSQLAPWVENCREPPPLDPNKTYTKFGSGPTVRITSDKLMEPRPGRERISGVVAMLGLGLLLFGIWPRRRGTGGLAGRGRHPFRSMCVVVGLLAAVYAVASLTGRWLGPPPWWESWVNGESETGIELIPTPGRQWILRGVAAVGLGLVAFGVWPRRRRGATS